MLSSDKLRRQEGKTADSIVQFPTLTIRRFTAGVTPNFPANSRVPIASLIYVALKSMQSNITL